MILAHLFTVEELAALDEKELEILSNAVLHEIRTHPELLRILRGRAHERYNEFRLQDRAPRARGSRSRRSPGPGTSG
jgi:pyruvate formate-lyase activating enzyme-like uncharacterized protein